MGGGESSFLFLLDFFFGRFELIAAARYIGFVQYKNRKRRLREGGVWTSR